MIADAAVVSAGLPVDWNLIVRAENLTDGGKNHGRDSLIRRYRIFSELGEVAKAAEFEMKLRIWVMERELRRVQNN